jgi:nitrile hydratase subunit beta
VTFVVGQPVRVADRRHVGHHRTPGYVKGRTGVIARVHATYPNPETRAYGADGLPDRRLYLVALDGDANDRLYADVFEHWLEEA